MKEIKVGDKFRGIVSKQTATVVHTNLKHCTLEYDDKTTKEDLEDLLKKLRGER